MSYEILLDFGTIPGLKYRIGVGTNSNTISTEMSLGVGVILKNVESFWLIHNLGFLIDQKRGSFGI